MPCPTPFVLHPCRRRGLPATRHPRLAVPLRGRRLAVAPLLALVGCLLPAAVAARGGVPVGRTPQSGGSMQERAAAPAAVRAPEVPRAPRDRPASRRAVSPGLAEGAAVDSTLPSIVPLVAPRTCDGLCLPDLLAAALRAGVEAPLPVAIHPGRRMQLLVALEFDDDRACAVALRVVRRPLGRGADRRRTLFARHGCDPESADPTAAVARAWWALAARARAEGWQPLPDLAMRTKHSEGLPPGPQALVLGGPLHGAMLRVDLRGRSVRIRWAAPERGRARTVATLGTDIVDRDLGEVAHLTGATLLPGGRRLLLTGQTVGPTRGDPARPFARIVRVPGFVRPGR